MQSIFLQNDLQNLDSFARDRHPEEQFNFLKLLLRSRESPTLLPTHWRNRLAVRSHRDKNQMGFTWRPRLGGEVQLISKRQPCTEICFFFVLIILFVISLHAAQRAMAAALALPLAGQRRAFLNSLFLPRTSSRSHSEISQLSFPPRT